MMAASRTYPYTNARVRAMRGDLVTDQEYRQLAKMSLSEIAEFLANRGYREEIEEYGGDYTGADLLDRALKTHMGRIHRKLVDIAPADVAAVLLLYYRRFDVQNMKLLLRYHVRGSAEDITPLLFPTPHLDDGTREQLLDADSVDDVIAAMPVTAWTRRIQDAVPDTDDLQAVEDALDAAYYADATGKAKDLSSALFTDYLWLDAALTNINLILRMQRRDYAYDDIMRRLLTVPRHKQIVDNEQLAGADGIDETMNLVRDTPIGEYFTGDSPAEIERGLETYKLRRGIRMLHTDQLSLNPILGFMICTQIEYTNLRMIVTAKAEGLGEDFIDRNLVLGVSAR